MINSMNYNRWINNSLILLIILLFLFFSEIMQECSHHFEHTFEPQALSLQASRIICELPPVWSASKLNDREFWQCGKHLLSSWKKKEGIISWWTSTSTTKKDSQFQEESVWRGRKREEGDVVALSLLELCGSHPGAKSGFSSCEMCRTKSSCGRRCARKWHLRWTGKSWSGSKACWTCWILGASFDLHSTAESTRWRRLFMSASW